jgi:hypothetical protein
MDTQEITRKCKECFSYNRPGNISQCCNKNQCNYEVASTISATNPNITCGASFQTLLNQKISNYYECNQLANTTTISTINNINSDIISSQLQQQLLNYGVVRNNPYLPVRNEIIPPSVLQLQRETVNVGVAKPISICRPKPMSLSYNFMG